MSNIRSADHALMREMNVALVLECLRQESPLSRAELSQITSLTKATVSSLVQELLHAGFVREIGIHTSGDKGRPSIQLDINPEAGYILGAEIGVDFISVVLTNFAAEILWRHQESTEELRGQEEILERTIQVLQEANTYTQGSAPPILGLGLGVPGLVDTSTGTLHFASNLHWIEVPLRKILEGRFNFLVFVDNSAKLAALGENYFGAARGADFVLYLSFGAGVGAGIVLNRRILPGATGFTGEVGHMTLDPEGPRCNCGNFGCWETYVSKYAVIQRIRTALAAGRASSLTEPTPDQLDQLSIDLIVEAARRGDEVARDALRETGYFIGLGLANQINMLNPQRVVLGGALSAAHEFLLPAIHAVLQARALRWSRETAEIVIAEHGSDACVMGGIASVYRHVLAQPLRV